MVLRAFITRTIEASTWFSGFWASGFGCPVPDLGCRARSGFGFQVYRVLAVLINRGLGRGFLVLRDLVQGLGFRAQVHELRGFGFLN